MTKISMIVPIYNASKYLGELLNSIIMQKYDDFEVLLINDGSTDNSDEICSEYVKKDSRFKYFYKDNSGVSDTRNYGVEHATGKYICFVDADDSLSQNYLLDFINVVEDDKSQMVCCGYIRFSDRKSIENIVQLENNSKVISSGKDKYNLLFSTPAGYIWNKFFEKEIIVSNGLKFNTNISMSEDLLFVFEYLKYCDSVSCIDNKNYYYRFFSQSASKNLSNIKWFSIYSVFDVVLSDKELYSAALYNRILFMYIYYLYQGEYRLKFIKSNNAYLDTKKALVNRIKSINKFNYNFSIKQRLKLFIYKYFNGVAFKIKFRKENNV